MTLILGVDPGAGGAFAVYNAESNRLVSITDMPVWYQTVGKRKLKRVDALALADMFDTFEMMDIDLVVMEAVGGRPRQSASGAFVFGYGVGLIYMAALYNKLPIETVPPATWKKLMNVPGKQNGSDDDIIARADEMFPHDRHLWRGGRGGKRVDRAEAAMMARFGAEYVTRTLDKNNLSDAELRLAYQNADTGA